MISFTALIKKFQDKGEKTGWTYIEIPSELADQLYPGNKKSFRVKGNMDSYSFEGIAVIPIGEGNFILALNLDIRKKIRKGNGDTLKICLEVDNKEKPLSEELLICLADEPLALEFFRSLPKGHQRYFSNWIESSKTATTKTKRIAQAVNALALHLGFGEMIRMNKKNNY
ncbi:MAG: YdeI/OmpD-associated family protein [Bacteroidota bacterium]|nr:YdeI/OmpD-associated family protein [Bacteroidota bacterium]